MKKLLIGLAVLLSVVGCVVLALALWVGEKYGGGEPFPDIELGEARFTMDAVELVADLPLPPGNVAVSPDGRVFITFHPEGRPEYNVAEIVDGQAQPWPNKAMQSHFDTVLSLRIDAYGQLWTLDAANHGYGQPRLTAFSLETGEVVQTIDFDSTVAPKGSHLNDFQIHPNGLAAFIADASIMGLKPALLIVDLKTGETRRVLEEHVSVMPEKFIPLVQGRKMEVFGIFAIRPGVDSIALNWRGTDLYFGAVTAQHLYRVSVRDLLNTQLDAEGLESRVTEWRTKPETDGITTDSRGGVYFSSPSYSAILRLDHNNQLVTLLKDDKIRWPDGFSFGPDGWLYFTCSSLHQVLGKTNGAIADAGPYQVYRFKPGFQGHIGH